MQFDKGDRRLTLEALRAATWAWAPEAPLGLAAAVWSPKRWAGLLQWSDHRALLARRLQALIYQEESTEAAAELLRDRLDDPPGLLSGNPDQWGELLTYLDPVAFRVNEAVADFLPGRAPHQPETLDYLREEDSLEEWLSMLP